MSPTDTIGFEAQFKIERGMPALLSHAGMSATAWQDFCDGVDGDLGPLLRARRLRIAAGFALSFMLLVYAANIAMLHLFLRPIMMFISFIIMAVTLFAFVCTSGYLGEVAKEGAARVSKRCEEVSNGVRDVVVTLHTDEPNRGVTQMWHIEVEGRRGAGDVECAATTCVTATAVEPEIVVHAVAVPTAPQKE